MVTAMPVLGTESALNWVSRKAAQSLATDTTGQIDLAGQWVYHKANMLTLLPQPPAQSHSANRPTLIYNAMINPILPYTIKGVIWYQGESNADRATQYRRLFPLLINDWRQKWNEGNFPFYFVQIANYNATEQPPAADKKNKSNLHSISK
ncbi:MAG: hypothetical protein NVSMB24_26520 [Mucilaginibacter sp.]